MTDKIITQCPHCSKKYRLNAAKFADKRIKCPNCGQPIRVGSQQETKQPTPTSPETAAAQPQSPAPRSEPAIPAHSSQSQTFPARKGWKKKAFAAVAALVLILVYTYWTDLRAWYVEATPGEARTVKHPENKTRKLAREVMDKLNLSGSEKEKYNQVITSYVQQGVPRAIPWPLVSKSQERVIHYHSRKARSKTNDLLNTTTPDSHQSIWVYH